jgi:hypothetical protein
MEPAYLKVERVGCASAWQALARRNGVVLDTMIFR